MRNRKGAEKLERGRVEKVDRSDLVNIKLQSICACLIFRIFFIVIDIIIVTILIIIYVINKIIKLHT